ncbi:hypothetical protein GE061_018350 [Apolygus lucorum]|uniref:Carbohydrate kinase PfkB domain-containing protein n=1 Tax=Apolygus lucorum TaxID=248454 RepID=A0A6A4JAV8_APOLU|nr:hypothetical protein GE061_018350 [Apolygus lucorum]
MKIRDFEKCSFKQDTSGVRIVDKGRTACYSALIDTKGDAKLGVGDMEIHSNISPTQIAANGNSLITSDFVVIDGNIPAETIESVLNISHNNRIPVWFEPTDVLKSQKPFNTNLWTTISCSSPNLFELKEMASAAGVRLDEELLLNNVDGLLKQLLYLGQPLVEHIPILMVTMGKLGMLMLSQCSSDESLRDALLRPRKPEIYARYYPAVPLPNVVNSLGAGDNTAAGFIDGLLRGLTEPECVALGHLASREALQSPMAVPKEFKSYKADSQTKAAYLEVALG